MGYSFIPKKNIIIAAIKIKTLWRIDCLIVEILSFSPDNDHQEINKIKIRGKIASFT